MRPPDWREAWIAESGENDDEGADRGRGIAMQHLDPRLGRRDGAGRQRGLGGGDVRARADRAGMAVAPRPVGTAEPGIAEPGEGAEQDEVEGQHENEPGERLQAERGARRRAGAARTTPAERARARRRRRERRAAARGRPRRWRSSAGTIPAGRRAQQLVEVALQARRIGIDRDAHHPVAARIDDVEMVLERAPRCRREPGGERLAASAQDGGRREGRARVARRGDRGQGLRREAPRRRRSARPCRPAPCRRRAPRAAAAAARGGARSADRRRAPATTTTSHWPRSDDGATDAPPRSASGNAVGHRPRRLDQLAVVRPRLRAQHEVREIRGDHRRGADEQHDEHEAAAALGAAQRGVLRRRQRVDAEADEQRRVRACRGG